MWMCVNVNVCSCWSGWWWNGDLSSEYPSIAQCQLGWRIDGLPFTAQRWSQYIPESWSWHHLTHPIISMVQLAIMMFQPLLILTNNWFKPNCTIRGDRCAFVLLLESFNTLLWTAKFSQSDRETTRKWGITFEWMEVLPQFSQYICPCLHVFWVLNFPVNHCVTVIIRTPWDYLFV